VCGYQDGVGAKFDDERLLVLHPDSDRRWRFRTSGVADNFQLHMILANVLLPENGAVRGMQVLEGVRPTLGVLAVWKGDRSASN
jgi:hypothetical protein